MSGRQPHIIPTREDVILSANERRDGCRYTVAQNRGWLGWWQDETFQNTSAEIIDISVKGCRMIVEEMPPSGAEVWFCPPGASSAEWIEAKQVESKKRLFGPRQVRIVFRHPFPYETFRDVIYGWRPGSAGQGPKSQAATDGAAENSK